MKLPIAVPILYHGNSRTERFDVPMACLPLYSVVRRRESGLRFDCIDDVLSKFHIERGTRLLLTGTAKDSVIERWWSLGRGRKDTIKALKDLGVEIVTTPNFSLFVNRPRWDDLHSIKRIAIAHEEFLSAGIRCALHLNARTERDWERWLVYLQERDEITDVAVEFSTGAGKSDRMNWHVNQLTQLSRHVGRQLHLVTRGVIRNQLAQLFDAFPNITVLDSNAFMKSVYRRRGNMCTDGKVTWHRSPTKQGEPLDSLLSQNWMIMRKKILNTLDVHQAS